MSAATAGEVTNVTFAEAGGHRVAAVCSANPSGEVVVFIPGITTGVTFWPAVFPDGIRSEFRWLSLSLPGHHPSSVPAGFSATDVTAEHFADTLADAIRILVPSERVHLVGWSTGGFSALAIAARHPELVLSVTSVCGFVRGRWGGLLGFMQREAQCGRPGRALFAATMGWLSRHPRILARIFAGLAADPRQLRNSAVMQRARSAIEETFRRHDFSVLAQLFAGLRTTDASSLVSTLTAPTLIIGGARDRVIRGSETRYLASLISHCELMEVVGCGHLFFAEAEAVVWPRIQDWIRDHAAKSS